MPELDKTYTPAEVEARWYQQWLDDKAFVADPARVSDKRPAYSIVIPPPNVTGILTLGHVLNVTIQDILCRRARMLGKEVLWLPGTDHAGIATQNVVEKNLKKQGAIKHRGDLGRVGLVEKIWEWKEKHGGIIIQQLKKLGASCDWSRERFTMDPEYSRCVQRVFVDLYKKGMIYRGKRMVNWCPSSLTALSDEEVTMKPQNGTMYHFKVEVIEEPGTWLEIATTRPEVIPGDTAIAVNPKDPRYAHLIGKHVRRPLPLENQAELPIVGDEHVDFTFGTGVLKVTPAHDKADFEIAQRHSLPVIDVMHQNGILNELAGKDLGGLERFAARKRAAELLTEIGAMVKEEPYQNNVGYSERADVPIEHRLSEQWFLKYPSVEQAKACVTQDFASTMGGNLGSTRAPRVIEGAPVFNSGANSEAKNIDAAREVDEYSARAPKTTREGACAPQASAQMRFFPDRWAKVYDHWMGGLQDWCISRQLWWGHRLPVWYSRGHRDQKLMVRIVEGGQESPIQGINVRELRASAWAWARTHGLLGQDYINLDTNSVITLQESSLKHAFANFGLENIFLVPFLPHLLREAVLVATIPHEPPAPTIRKVLRFVSAIRLRGKLYRVKMTVKELQSGRRLYDHQSTQLEEGLPEKEMEPGGVKSLEGRPLSGKLPSQPTPGSGVMVGDLMRDVNTTDDFVRCQIQPPGEGWEQDPDVLDTWFSSWLWPFATMGWPNETADLKAFYPTTDLVTAPDIIFFWVARMIMAGYEYMGELPFKNVYFTGIIRDKQGRKMSKSLGNSPDPLELIANYSADALRFGIMRSAPLGADIAFDEKNVELGRNFCTKLWNAARFRQMAGTSKDEGGSMKDEILDSETSSLIPHPSSFSTEDEINPVLLTRDDKWILLRLNTAIIEVTTALEEYRFSDATQSLYRFFWTEYCDWYVEASKATLRPVEELKGLKVEGNASSTVQPINLSTREAQRANTVAVIDFVLGHTLRLLHPFIPFITEELWHGLGFNADMPENQGGKSIMFAPWPKPMDADELVHFGILPEDEKTANDKYETVNLGRTLKSGFNINKKVRFVLKPASELPEHDIDVLRILLNAEPLDVDAAFVAKKGTPTVLTPLGELFLPLDGIIDVEAERARVTKEMTKVETELGKVKAKLADENFTSKVPQKVLDDHQQRAADWSAQLVKLTAMLEALA